MRGIRVNTLRSLVFVPIVCVLLLVSCWAKAQPTSCRSVYLEWAPQSLPRDSDARSAVRIELERAHFIVADSAAEADVVVTVQGGSKAGAIALSPFARAWYQDPKAQAPLEEYRIGASNAERAKDREADLASKWNGGRAFAHQLVASLSSIVQNRDTIVIASEPPGATIEMIGGSLVRAAPANHEVLSGFVTPATLHCVAKGLKVTARLSLPGYEPTQHEFSPGPHPIGDVVKLTSAAAKPAQESKPIVVQVTPPKEEHGFSILGYGSKELTGAAFGLLVIFVGVLFRTNRPNLTVDVADAEIADGAYTSLTLTVTNVSATRIAESIVLEVTDILWRKEDIGGLKAGAAKPVSIPHEKLATLRVGSVVTVVVRGKHGVPKLPFELSFEKKTDLELPTAQTKQASATSTVSAEQKAS